MGLVHTLNTLCTANLIKLQICNRFLNTPTQTSKHLVARVNQQRFALRNVSGLFFITAAALTTVRSINRDFPKAYNGS